MSDTRGRISIVGIGYGAGQLTESAHKALADAQLVTGANCFIEQVRSLINPGAATEDGAMGAADHLAMRTGRVTSAINGAQRGLRVALLSSGDPGLWGMSAYLYKEIAVSSGSQASIDVELLPGITAAQALAARVGAPLMNGYALLSLCDDITEPAVCEKRLRACAQGDLVTVVYKLRYNAEERPEWYPPDRFPQFHPPAEKAYERFTFLTETFLEHRSRDTHVVIGSRIGESQETLRQLRLAELRYAFGECINRAVLLIGNSETHQQGPWLVSR